MIHNSKCRAAVLCALCTMFGTRTSAELDGEVVPGRIVYINKESFGPTAHGKPPRAGIYVPKDYTPDKPFPLAVWFGPLKGGSVPGRLKEATNGEGWICVAVPYKQPKRKDQGGWFVTEWEDYRVFLDEVEKNFPNIDPSCRVAAGYSSGAAAVAKGMEESPKGFRAYFTAFAMGGGSRTVERPKDLRGKSVFFFGGGKDPRCRPESSAQVYRRSKVDAEFYVEKDAGHEMLDVYWQKLGEWMNRRTANPAAAPAEAEAAPTSAAVADYRAWTSASGSRIEAKMISFDNPWVLLSDRAGKEIKIDISRLSTADRDYVQQMRKP